MSSRTGPRAAGTDGSDYSHREQVASHYKDSVKWKLKLKLNLCLHMALVAIVAVWSMLSYMKFVEYEMQVWQLVWLGTAIPVLLGLASLSKNRYMLMCVYVIGAIVFGFAPMVYGASEYFQVILRTVQSSTGARSTDMRGFSIKMAFIALALQMQIMAIYYAIRLINTWKSKGGEKKTS